MKQSVAKTMEAEEIIAMRCKAHGLSAKRPGREIVRGLCGLQSQFTMQARHALTIRADDGDAALADCVRTWTVRGTMHTILREDAPLYLYDGRTHALRLCDRMADDEQMSVQRKRALGEIIREAIRNGEGEREALRQICRANGMTGDEERSAFDAWGGLLRAMAENGEIAYAAEKGRRFVLLEPQPKWDRERARDEILRRYFAGYGPATIRDAAYFTGWGMRDIAARAERLDLKRAACNGEDFFLDARAGAGKIPKCAYLAGFDPMMLGYEKKTSLMLAPENLRGVFNLAGIVAPTVLLDGRVAGKWKKTGKKLEVTLFRAIKDGERRAMAEEAEKVFGERVRMKTTGE